MLRIIMQACARVLHVINIVAYSSRNHVRIENNYRNNWFFFDFRSYNRRRRRKIRKRKKKKKDWKGKCNDIQSGVKIFLIRREFSNRQE